MYPRNLYPCTYIPEVLVRYKDYNALPVRWHLSHRICEGTAMNGTSKNRTYDTGQGYRLPPLFFPTLRSKLSYLFYQHIKTVITQFLQIF